MTELYLLKNVKLDPNYNWTMDFDSETVQHNYFLALADSNFTINDDYKFIRKGSIKVNANYEDIFGDNYLMYNNNDKWYYAFITHKEYINKETTRLDYEIDPMQTFMFDYSIEESFVEREHQDRFDSEGDPIYNLENENLEIGKDYNVSHETFRPPFLSSKAGYCSFMLIISKEPLGQVVDTKDSNGVPLTWKDDGQKTDIYSTDTIDSISHLESFDLGYYAYLIPAYNDESVILKTSSSNYEKATCSKYSTVAIYGVDENPNVIAAKHIPYINNNGIYYEGTDLVFSQSGRIIDSEVFKTGTFTLCKYLSGSLSANIIKIKSLNTECFSRYTITDTLPTNSTNILDEASYNRETKLYTHPYSFFRLNGMNEFKELKRENFSGSIKFEIKNSLSLTGGMCVYPLNYNNQCKCYNEALQLKNSLDLTLRTDAWQSYELNNKASMNGSLIVSGLQTVGTLALGAASGGLGLAFAGGQALSFAGQVANDLIKRSDIKQTPDEVRPALNDISSSFSQHRNLIEFEMITIKEIFRQKVGNYFIHYGYGCNDFKKPDTRSRYYFNYIKTVGVNLFSNVDNEYISQIENIYNTGLTIWHYRNATTFKGVNNYNYENVEMNLIGD